MDSQRNKYMKAYNSNALHFFGSIRLWAQSFYRIQHSNAQTVACYILKRHEDKLIQ